MTRHDRERLPSPQWRQVGEEPDYRFTLANERTFLAWIRTALALLAAGVLLDQFSTKLRPPELVVAVGALLCMAAFFVSALSYLRWKRNEQAMRAKAPLPHSRLLGLLAAILMSIGIAVCLLMVVNSLGFS